MGTSGVLFCFCSFPFAYCSRQKRKQYSLCSEAVSSRDQRSEWHIFERRYATAFHFVVSGGEALYSAHSPVIKREVSARLSFSWITDRRNHTSDLYLTNLCHIFPKEGICKFRASCLGLNNNPRVPSTLSVIKNAIVFIGRILWKYKVVVLKCIRKLYFFSLAW